MQLKFHIIFLISLVLNIICTVSSQNDAPFELPVQLIGFPVIIAAVRISNFLKKLSYAVNPNTYRSRSRRDLLESPVIDVLSVEKKLIKEMGHDVCIYEEVCEAYAKEAEKRQSENNVLDWQDIYNHYESTELSKRDYYLLSVFLGDIVASPNLCKILAKRGRSCNGNKSFV